MTDTHKSAVDRVTAWHKEWLEADGPHWGDKIHWGTADEIAHRLDEAHAEEHPDRNCLVSGNPETDSHYCRLPADHTGPCQVIVA